MVYASAFTFKGTTEENGVELTGIWFGKFEPSGSINNIKIVPDSVSLNNQSISAYFNASKNFIANNNVYNLPVNGVDAHIAKNIDWGAVAYLTQSKYGRYESNGSCISGGCEVWINNTSTAAVDNCGSTITGCSGSSVSAFQNPNRSSCDSGYRWYEKGVNASTMGNSYGIYDMAGGSEDYVMGVSATSNGSYVSGYAGTLNIDSRYYDLYSYSLDSTDGTRGHLGDATRETKNWYGDGLVFVVSNYGGTNNTPTYFYRGLYAGGTDINMQILAGIYDTRFNGGNAFLHFSTRFVITKMGSYNSQLK